jgi:hypothetical protein
MLSVNALLHIALFLSGAVASFPLVVGTEWVYEVGIEEFRETITKVEFRDDAHFVSISRLKSGKEKPYRVVKVAKDGLFDVEFHRVKLSQPSCLLKLPAKMDDTWEAEGCVVTTRKIEEVTVPAGKFKAIRVEWEMTFTKRDGTKGTLTEIYWHAPGVGVVKKQLGFGELGETKLKSFTLGKGVVP